MSANTRQVGGSHYQAAVQHWDLVIRNHVGYAEGCSTKYLTRWKKKNGLEDLNKAVHFLDKLIEESVVSNHSYFASGSWMADAMLVEFIQSNSIDPTAEAAIRAILYWNTEEDLKVARGLVLLMVKELEDAA